MGIYVPVDNTSSTAVFLQTVYNDYAAGKGKDSNLTIPGPLAILAAATAVYVKVLPVNSDAEIKEASDFCILMAYMLPDNLLYYILAVASVINPALSTFVLDTSGTKPSVSTVVWKDTYHVEVCAH